MNPDIKISASSYCPETRVLRVRGWASHQFDEFRLEAGDQVVRHVTRNLPRRDVLKQHPDLPAKRPGWLCDVRWPFGVAAPDSVRASIVTKDGVEASVKKPVGTIREDGQFGTEVLDFLERLNEGVEAANEPFEGGMFYLQTHNFSSRIAPTQVYRGKRESFFRAGHGRKNVLEIGFNGGHSAALLLLSNPGMKYLGIDLGEHSYAHRSAELMRQAFPGRFDVIFGDSREVAPWLRASHKGELFDMIHVDGGHTEGICRADIANTID